MWNTAVMAMISLSAIGFAVADGETRRVRWIQAMSRCILRMNDVIRYERLPLAALLARMDLRATREQRELTRLLHLCCLLYTSHDFRRHVDQRHRAARGDAV